MGWKPQPRYDKTRKCWHCRVNKKKHYLGVDEAEAYRRFAEIIQGAVPSGKPVVVAEAVETWLSVHGHARASWRWAMLQSWHTFAGALELSKIGQDHLAGYRTHLEQLGNGRSTTIHKVRSASLVLKWCVEAGYLDKAPRVPTMPKAVRRPRDVDNATLADAFSTLPDHTAAVLGFILETGCRPKEARLLRWRDVDLDHRLVTLDEHKTDHTGRPRCIALSPAAMSILEKRPRTSEFVFVSRRGTPYTHSGLYSAAKYHGLPDTYGLRHTFAQHALDADVSLEDVGGLLNHSSPSTTLVYAQIRQDRTRRVADSLAAVGPPQPVVDSDPQIDAARQKEKRAIRRSLRKRARRREG